MKKLGCFITLCLVLSLAGCDKSPAPVISDNADLTPAEVTAEMFQLLDEYRLIDEDLTSERNPGDPEDFPPDISDTTWDVYAVTFLWGRMFNACVTDAAPTVWDGTLSVNGVAVVYPALTIEFENGQDSLVPYSIESSAAWGSSTATGDFDGISFLVFNKRGIVYITEPLLTFDTEPFTLSLSFSELDNYLAFFAVDECNAVAVHARKLKPQSCMKGLLAGEWIKEEPFGQTGRMEGRWLDADGNPIGLYVGKFWKDNDTWEGRGEFEGSVSGYYTDEVIATFKGYWWYDDMSMCPMCGEGHGQFAGRVFYSNDPTVSHQEVGSMKGEFGWREDFESVVYPMSGIWSLKCNATSISLDAP